MRFSNEGEQGRFVLRSALSSGPANGARPPLIIVVDATSARTQNLPTLVDERGIPAEWTRVALFGTLEDFEKPALANSDQQAVVRVRTAITECPGRVVVYAMDDGSSTVSVVKDKRR